MNGFLISWARRRHLARPGPAGLKQFPEMSSKTRRVASGSSAPPHHEACRVPGPLGEPHAAQRGCCQWSSPWWWSPETFVKLPWTAAAKSARPGTAASGWARQTTMGTRKMFLRGAQAWRTGSGSLRIQHHHARREVVQNGLQAWRARHPLPPMLLTHPAPVCNLLRHGGKGSGQSVELVLALQCRLGAEAASGHLLHTPRLSTNSRPHQLVAQQHRQQHRAKHRQKQAQRQCAHTCGANPREQGALLVFTGGGFAPRARLPPGPGAMAS